MLSNPPCYNGRRKSMLTGKSLFTKSLTGFVTDGILPPKGETWHTRTLRRILTDPRMTGQNVQIFTVKNKRAKQHLDAVDLPDGTYPRILSDKLYTPKSRTGARRTRRFLPVVHVTLNGSYYGLALRSASIVTYVMTHAGTVTTPKRH